MRKLFLLCLAVVVFATATNAQEKPIRVGLNLGTLYLAGLNVEYVTPAMNGKLAPALDLTYIPLTLGDVDVSISYIGASANMYFKEDGKGAYGSVGLGRLGVKATYTDAFLGTGEGKIGINLLNLKLGAKWGNTVYFRPELGYAIAIGDAKIKVDYNGVEQEEEVPNVLKGGFILNLGFGVAF